MVLTARSASLLSSRSPALLSSVLRSCSSRAALHTNARSLGYQALLNRSGFKLQTSGPGISYTPVRLLTSQRRQKVKVLLVLYDGGVHAEQVSPPFFLGPLELPMMELPSRPMQLVLVQCGVSGRWDELRHHCGVTEGWGSGALPAWRTLGSVMWGGSGAGNLIDRGEQR